MTKNATMNRTGEDDGAARRRGDVFRRKVSKEVDTNDPG